VFLQAFSFSRFYLAFAAKAERYAQDMQPASFAVLQNPGSGAEIHLGFLPGLTSIDWKGNGGFALNLRTKNALRTN